MSMIRVQIPATCANLGPGLFSTALALRIHNTVDVSEREMGFRVQVVGDEFVSDEMEMTGFILAALEKYFRHIGRAPSGLDISVDQSIPAHVGLGNERAIELACLLGVNLLLGNPLGREELVQLMAKPRLEGSALVAALRGGLISSAVLNNRLVHESLPVRISRVGVVFPHKLLVEDRNSEDAQIPLTDVFTQSRGHALMLHALATENFRLLADCFHGVEYQAALVPGLAGYEDALAAGRELKSTAVSLSGHGPALIVFGGDNLEDAVDYVRSALRRGIKAEVSSWIVPVDTQGVAISEMGGNVTYRQPPIPVDDQRAHAGP